MESFSTLGLPVARKVSFWNAISSETFALMEIKPRDVFRFDGTLKRERIGPLTLMDVCSAAAHIQHTHAHIARLPHPSYLLLAPLRGELELQVAGAPGVRVRDGELCLIDHARPYELVHGDAMRTLCIDIPRHSFDERVPGAAHLVGRLIRPDRAISRILMGLLRTLGNEVSLTAFTGLPSALGHNLLSFVAATYSSYTKPLVARGVKARAMNYRAHIDSCLGDPDLAPADIASHFGVSARYLRAVLRAAGESFSTYLLRQRLARAAHSLRNPDCSEITITEIAFHCGFSNVTHFGQAFKRRYGLTPREFRRSAQDVG